MGAEPKTVAIPVPERDRDNVESDALLVTETDPLEGPAAVGEKLIWNEVLAPGARLNCGGNPLTEKPIPVVLTWSMLALASPVFVSVTVCATLLPTFTLPKSSLVGLAASSP